MATLNQIERMALELPEADRARLASHLLESLPSVLDEDDEGVAEAIRRDAEMDADPSQGMSLEEFDEHARQRRS
jgi:putative addiction module component (TIGR02574 family)